MPTAVAYTRVSTEEQALHGVSLDAQEDRIRAYCAMQGLEVVELVREEGVSAARPLASRPGGTRLLELVAAGKTEHVVALKLDRLFRDAADCLNQTRGWDRAGVALHLVDLGGTTINTASAMGRMFLTLTAAFAELERNLIAERTRTALQYKKAQGAKLGGARPHQRIDQDTAARILELKAEGLPLRAIAEKLTAERRATLRGGSWAFDSPAAIADGATPTGAPQKKMRRAVAKNTVRRKKRWMTCARAWCRLPSPCRPWLPRSRRTEMEDRPT